MTDSLNYNFFNTLVFSGVIYGLVFCAAVMYDKKYYSGSLIFLVLTVLSMTLSNLQYWLIDIGLREKLNVPKVYYIQFELLILPFYYLFVSKYLSNKITKRQTMILLMPFALGMIYQIIIYSFDVDKPQSLKYNLIAEILTIAYSIILIVLIFRKIILYEKSNRKDEILDNLIAKTNWLKYNFTLEFSFSHYGLLQRNYFIFKDSKHLKLFTPYG